MLSLLNTHSSHRQTLLYHNYLYLKTTSLVEELSIKNTAILRTQSNNKPSNHSIWEVEARSSGYKVFLGYLASSRPAWERRASLKKMERAGHGRADF